MRRSRHASRVWLNPVAVWELLDRLGISQNELARRCRFSPGHLSMLMNGKRSPSPRARRRLMEVLRVDDFDLLFITEPPDAEGRGTEEMGAPKRKKGPTNAKTATQEVASGRGRTH
ncbi:MAG: helix-turn-helix transcriptional regulator [Chloroflexota bacterium]|nr:helix-turn-helix transcriptional regulator [Chloroflexota bacterium]